MPGDALRAQRTIAAGSGAAANSVRPTRLTATSVVCADSTTDTSKV